LKKNLQKIREEILNHWSELPPEFVTSAEKKKGRTEILNFIGEANQHFDM
jgi:GTP-binding protein